jgi:hypothetical protein
MTVRSLLQEDSWYSFLLETDRPQGHSAAGRIRPIEKSSEIIRNRIRDLPACSIVPQPTTLPRASKSGSLAKFFCLGRKCLQPDHSLTPQELLLALQSHSHKKQTSSYNQAECRVEVSTDVSNNIHDTVCNWAEVTYCHMILSCAQPANRDYEKSFPLWRRTASLHHSHESVSSYQSSGLRSCTGALVSSSALQQYSISPFAERILKFIFHGYENRNTFFSST